MKFFLLIFFLSLISCTKQKEESGYCVSVTTFIDGVEIKKVVSAWNNHLMKPDTIFCEAGLKEQMIITSFHRCK